MKVFKLFTNAFLRAALLTVAALVVFAGWSASSAAAQSALDGFSPTVDGTIRAVVVQPDGKILIGGDFLTVEGAGRIGIARLNADESLDIAFNPNANGTVNAIAVQPDGKVLVGGSFTGIGGQARNNIARLDAVSGAADAFNPNANNVVNAIAVQSDGKTLVGGQFTSIGGQTRNRIARLDQTSGAADSWNPNANSQVFSITVQSDGKILAGGSFTGIGGQPRNFVARLDQTTGAADSWNPSANGAVNAAAIQSDGKILVGGQFALIGGAARNYFARLSNDTAALSALSVTKTSVALTRNGSAAQFTRVVFEQSTDGGATYTALGTATNSFAAPAGDDKVARLFAAAAPQAASYALTGLNLPSGQNILIRARGFYRTGFQNGSETIEDKVQNAFLPAPTAAAVSISGRVLTPEGRGLTNAFVTLIDANGETKTARTGSFGYYRFSEIAAGQTVVIAVRSKRYQFAAQIVNAAQEIEDLNFYAER